MVAIKTPERGLVQALRMALDPTPVVWGWAPFESSTESPSLPLVVLQRLNFSSASYEDMCRDAAIVGDVLVLLHVWALTYEGARSLMADARLAMGDAGGWRLQSEGDAYEPAFRAWRIEGQWLSEGVVPD